MAIRDFYTPVNAARKSLPLGVRMTDDQARAALLVVWRAMADYDGEPERGRWIGTRTIHVVRPSGKGCWNNPQTWCRGKVFRLAPAQGWADLVHMVSHYYHRKWYRSERPHCERHASLEWVATEALAKWAQEKGIRAQVSPDDL